MPKDKREVEAALLGKGFQAREGNHHYFVYHSLEGKKSLAKTKTSHAGKMKVLSDALLGEMARQCKLTRPQFLCLVECPMSRDEYEAVLRTGGCL